MGKWFNLSAVMLLTIVLMTGCSEIEKPVPEEMAPKKAVTFEKEEKPVKVQKAVAGEIIIADFNTGEKPNNIGGNFGAWDKDPADFSQGCSESFDSVNKHGRKGFAMKLDYDVDSNNPAYNGFWMFLEDLDVSKYDNLAFWVKGDPEEGYTTVFKLELKNAKKHVGRYYVTDITGEWQEIVIPLKAFKGITDFSGMTELLIVFEDRVASNKDGVIYIDDIQFTKSR